MGHIREDLTRYPVRFWRVGAYLIIYRAERQPIEIVAVTQGARGYSGVPASTHALILVRARFGLGVFIPINRCMQSFTVQLSEGLDKDAFLNSWDIDAQLNAARA